MYVDNLESLNEYEFSSFVFIGYFFEGMVLDVRIYVCNKIIGNLDVCSYIFWFIVKYFVLEYI